MKSKNYFYTILFYLYHVIHVTLLMGLIISCLVLGTWLTIQWYFIPQLPSTELLKDVHLQVPLHIYTEDNVFMAEYGEQRRIPVTMEQVPPLLIKAILAAEDDRFYEHKGVDLKSLLRAAFSLLKTGEKLQGGSTITMQVARNFFLSYEKTYLRKFKEILLAFKIEDELPKEEILKLYLNKIYFGHRAYGVGAAAQIYYGKNINELTLAQFAILASLPKAPSNNNPLINSASALERRNYILGRMLFLKYISEEQHNTAVNAPLTAKLHKLVPEVDALYVAEMVRSYLFEKFGEKAYTSGFKVFTTINTRLQERANAAVRRTLFRYDRIRGYKGPLDHVSIPKKLSDVEKWADKILQKYTVLEELIPSVVLRVRSKSIIAYNQKAGQFKISWRGISWAHKRGRYPRRARQVVRRGDIIMARPLSRKKSKKSEKSQEQDYKPLPDDDSQHSKFKKVRWSLYQIPKVEGALVAIKPRNGAIRALAGGFDSRHSSFNRVTQAQRQPGSSFKPFIYSAALAKGYSPSSPVKDAKRRSGWTPRNYTREYYGWTTLRTALKYSFNASAVRLLERIGVGHAINHITKFGFKRNKIPVNLTIALGTGEVTPLELTTGFAVFANGGFLITPYFIDRIEDMNGNVIFSANPPKICPRCPIDIMEISTNVHSDILVPHKICTKTPRYARRVISSNNAYGMNSMLRDVIRSGTARRARRLKRRNLAGKTGTTNNQHDVWFSGYSPDIVTTVWLGFDTPRSLGYRATGGNTALPMWIDFMSVALGGKSIQSFSSSSSGRSAKKKSSVKSETRRKTKKRTQKKRTAKKRKATKKKSTVIPEQLF